MKHLIFWQNAPSIHQAPLIRSLADRLGYKITLVCENSLSKNRKDMGWENMDYGKAVVYINPNEDKIQSLLKSRDKNTIHIISGIRGYKLMRYALDECTQNNNNVGVIVEAPRKTLWPIDLVKRVVYGMYAFKLKDRIDFILAMGRKGVDWYSKCGYYNQKIFLFGYVVDVLNEKQNKTVNNTFQLLYVGSLIKLKGVDLLLKALAEIDCKEWTLTIVGSGCEKDSLTNLSQDLGIIDKIVFVGSKTNTITKEYINNADLLVLPSRDDGWGAVVSEALMNGTPVVCSNNSGASSLIKSGERGDIFKSDSVTELSHYLKKWVNSGSISHEKRKAIQEWAQNHISPLAMSEYFNDIMEYVYGSGERPDDPWV